jgi:hypothetical protein
MWMQRCFERALDRCGSGVPHDSPNPGRQYSDERSACIAARVFRREPKISRVTIQLHLRADHTRADCPPGIDRNPSSKDPRFPAAGMAGFRRDQFVDGARVLGVGGRDDHDRAALDLGSHFSPVVRRESSPCLSAARSGAAPPGLPGLLTTAN